MFITIMMMVMMLWTGIAHSTTYHVTTSGSGSACTVGSPCGSIPVAIQKLVAGDFLEIHQGTYSNVVIDSSVFSIASGNDFGSGAITIEGVAGDTVTLLNGNINLPGSNPVSYIIFKNLHVDCNNNDCHLYFTAPTHHVRFDHVEVANGTTSSGGAGMVTGNAPYMEFLYMDVHDAGWPDCAQYSNQGCYGFYINGHHLIMDHCDIHHNSSTGAQVYHSGLSDMTDNIISNNRIYDNGGGHDARGYFGNGIVMASGVRNKMFNNLAWGNWATALSVYSNCDGCEVYNNTVVDNHSYGIEATYNNGAIIRNNIVVGNGDGSVGNQIIDNTGVAVIDHNMTTGNPVFTNRAGNVYTLDPGSPAIDTGSNNVPGVTVDRAGVARPQPPGGTFDMGAYEAGGGGGNTPPTITSIGNQTATQGVPVGPLAFIIGDVETPPGSLTVSGSSSNTTLIPNGSISFGGSGANRTVTVSIGTGQSGFSIITVGVSDGQYTTNTTFQITISSNVTVFHVAQVGGDDVRSCDTAGSVNTPLLTVGAGLNCLVGPGKTLYIHAGVYTEVIDTSVKSIPAGVSVGQPTTIAGYGTDVVVLRLVSGKGSIVSLVNSTSDHYLLFDRLVLDCAGVSGANAFIAGPGTHHVVFQNGEMKGCQYSLVFLNSVDSYSFINNKLHDDLLWYGFILYGSTSNTVINKNEVYNNWLGGVEMLYGGNNTITNTTITQNKVHNNSKNVAIPYAGVHIGGTGNTGNQVYNNVVYGEQVGVDIDAGSAGAKVYGNTVYGSVGVGVNVRTGALNTLLTNNIVYGNSGGNIVNNGTGTVQLTNYVVDPLFINPGGGNFNLDPASGAIDVGTNVAEYTIDNIGTTRPQRTVYTIGALEFIGTPNQPPPPPPPSGLVRVGTQWMSRGFMGK